MTTSEERRHDPELREEVKGFLDEQRQALEAAKSLLDEALKILAEAGIGVRGFQETGLYDEAVSAVFLAQTKLNHAITYGGRSDNETYVGNVAASAFGKCLQGKTARGKSLGE